MLRPAALWSLLFAAFVAAAPPGGSMLEQVVDLGETSESTARDLQDLQRLKRRLGPEKFVEYADSLGLLGENGEAMIADTANDQESSDAKFQRLVNEANTANQELYDALQEQSKEAKEERDKREDDDNDKGKVVAAVMPRGLPPPSQRVCADNVAWTKPFKAVKTILKDYASRCAHYKERGACKSRFIRKKCASTCDGKGSDWALWSKPVKIHVPVITGSKEYTSRCHYLKENNPSWCGRSRLAGKFCKKTCNKGGGADSGFYSKPFTAKTFARVEFKSRCAWFKTVHSDQNPNPNRKACNNKRIQNMCLKTCGAC